MFSSFQPPSVPAELCKDKFTKDTGSVQTHKGKLADKPGTLESEVIEKVAAGKDVEVMTPQRPPLTPTTPTKTPPSQKRSPRREGSGGRKRKDKDEPGLETFDSRLTSIITNALIGEEQNGPASLPPHPPTVVKQDSPRQQGNSGSPEGGVAREGGPYPPHVAPATSPIRGILRKHFQDDVPVSRAMEPSTAPYSIPVKIPLQDVYKKPSLPVSIPLSVCERGQARPDMGRAEQGRGRPQQRPPTPPREVYSPISRPSSSSSTASAESVRHMEHGTRVSSVSPKAAYHSESRSPGRRTPHKVAGPPEPLHPGMYPPPPSGHIPPPQAALMGLGLGGSVPGINEKELYLKMLEQQGAYPPGAGQFASASLAQAFYSHMAPVNGVAKMPQLSPEERVKKRSRKRTNKAPLPAGKFPPGGAFPDPPTHLPSRVLPPTTGNHGDIASMVSNATQPLAITAISDADSNKSSPLECSPTKLTLLPSNHHSNHVSGNHGSKHVPGNHVGNHAGHYAGSYGNIPHTASQSLKDHAGTLVCTLTPPVYTPS